MQEQQRQKQKGFLKPIGPVKAVKARPYFEAARTLLYKSDVLQLPGRNFADLIVTSPPYNVDIHYNSNKDDLLYSEYLRLKKAAAP